MVSIVIPLLNEADSLKSLHASLDNVLAVNQLAGEIIFVDDGSQDGSWDIIRELAARDLRIRGIRFRRNFGKAAALAAGFDAASNDVVITMDADSRLAWAGLPAPICPRLTGRSVPPRGCLSPAVPVCLFAA